VSQLPASRFAVDEGKRSMRGKNRVWLQSQVKWAKERINEQG
jgi:hypothetical protein